MLIRGIADGVEYKIPLETDGDDFSLGSIQTENDSFRAYLGRTAQNNFEDPNRDRYIKTRRLNPKVACSPRTIKEPDDQKICEIAKQLAIFRLADPTAVANCLGDSSSKAQTSPFEELKAK